MTRIPQLFHLLISSLLLVTTTAHSTRGAQINHDHKANMNGDYVLSSTPGGKDTQRLFPTNYKDYPDKETLSFDIYSPAFSQLYSQVFWKGLPPVKLPPEIVDRFKDKVMAVVGFELDQVMEDDDGNEFSVPFNAVYNHHFESTMIGGTTARFEMASPDDERLADRKSSMGHGIPPGQPYWLVVDDQESTGGQPTRQEFRGANGGEVRQSFHGYAPGFSQLIDSPHTIQITPMQIDTWNRDEMDLKNSTHFVAGPLPRNSLAPAVNATYSGLLECPVTTRIQKHLPPQGFFPLGKGRCSPAGRITGETDCFTAVSEMVRETDAKSPIHNVSGSDANRPAGCSVRALADTLQDKRVERILLEAFYNDHKGNGTECGAPQTQTVFSASATSVVQVNVLMDKSRDLVIITLTGPNEVWFGVGLGAHTMKDQPWTIVVEGNNGPVTERKLQDHAAGTVVTPPTIQVQSDTVKGDQRTVILTRSIQGPQYSFDCQATQIPFINAVGSSAQFSYHQKKEASSMLVLPVSDHSHSGGICLCQQDPPPFGKATGGSLEYHPVKGQPGEKGTQGRVGVGNHCAPYPRMDLLDQKNPTCDVRTYAGGQIACHHMWSLLDADQEIPWPDQPIEYRLKFRFWVQDYDANYHTNVHRTTWGIGSPVEYDVPKCTKGVPGCSQELNPATGEQRWVHTIRGKFSTGNGGKKLVAAHFHCHAPTCLKTRLYRCPEDKDVVCDETTGTLLCEENAVRKQGERGERFNEPDFIYQPPCLWGSSDVGLEPPVEVGGQTLFAIKTADATYGHHGEMAWLQMYYI